MRAVVSVEDKALDGIILSGQILEHLIQTVSLDELVWNDNVVLGAEVDAFLGLLSAANSAARNAQTTHDQLLLHNLMRGAN